VNPDDVTGWDLLFPRNPLHAIAWLLSGIMAGWMIRDWWIRRKR
jgi:hypothetical protein